MDLCIPYAGRRSVNLRAASDGKSELLTVHRDSSSHFLLNSSCSQYSGTLLIALFLLNSRLICMRIVRRTNMAAVTSPKVTKALSDGFQISYLETKVTKALSDVFQISYLETFHIVLVFLSYIYAM